MGPDLKKYKWKFQCLLSTGSGQPKTGPESSIGNIGLTGNYSKQCSKRVRPQIPQNNIPGNFSLFCLLLVTISVIGCSTARITGFDPAQKLDPGKMQRDFILLKKILEANHPSLYWYTSKDSLDIYFNEALAGMNDSLTELQYKNKVSWFISKINCGHTSVSVSKTYMEYAKDHPPARFPLVLKCWNDSLVVLGSMQRNDTVFKRGTIITSIDNRANRYIIDSLFQYISTDGYSNNFKNQAVSFNFPQYYAYAFPVKDSMLVGYTDSAGINKTAYVKIYRPVKDTGKKPLMPPPPAPSRKEQKKIRLLSKRSLEYDSSNHLAYMRVATFSTGKLKSFFRKSFREIEEKQVPDLVIDLRENTGGKINLSTKLARYLKDTSFHVADTVAATSRSLKYARYLQPSLPFRLMMRFTTRKESDGKFHFKNLEQHYYKPYSNSHYNGRIYIIQGGYTFSAASMFVLQLKGQQNVTVVGEETGGGNYGTSAVHLPSVILPGTKIKVSLPLYRVVPDRTQVKDGQGIMPDVYVPPSSVAIKKGIDPKLEKVREIIRQKDK
ncbi:MAG TPA: S41 family peptidase [Panacibacter sp.]|nr:S41 family peptidase [Panacibacter sp.]HNP42820.1 S41 family peptidase [Panacibacter sp.]